MNSLKILFSLVTVAAFCVIAGCATPDPASEKQPADANRAGPEQRLDERYSSPEYDMAFHRPSSWVLTEEPLPGSGRQAINLFKKGTGAGQDIPLHVHADPRHSYIAVLPGGWGTELPHSQYASFTRAKGEPEFSFPIDTAKSRVLQLKDGSPWAYFIVPADPPESWSDSGFIFAQIQTREDTLYCIDAETGEKQPAKKCDYSRGDQYIREGSLNQRDADLIHAILASFSLDEMQHN